MKIPVYSGPRIVEYANEARVAYLAGIQNAEFVWIRKSGHLTRINLHSVGDDCGVKSRRYNPRRYSHDHETEQNPNRVWTFRNLSKEQAR